ncbi:MAG: hypothetical protein Q7T36_14380 [Fluviicoccus sp.]|uniref:hypothetical protein n=1 Tax=Fluviicoccus sp. TaxID=2003552 RepID=UPI00271DD2F5|nr:hypothetical protein [Fluviicoccus sp.]MDO8331649.1 hypothetical protein [Fluviicoccus sp.]
MTSSPVSVNSAGLPPVVFVVSSPLQLFNAIEARDRFHSGQPSHLLIIWKKIIDNEQMQALLDDGWASCRWLRHGGWARAWYAQLLAPWLAAMAGAEVLYLGYPLNVRAHVANVLSPPRIVLLDDGHATLHLMQLLDDPAYRAIRAPGVVDRLLGRRVGLDYTDRAELFTVYRPDGWPVERMIHNDFRAFRAKAARLPHTGRLLFIGSDLAGNIIPDSATEERLFAAMSAYYAGREVVYSAHRYENVESMRASPALAGIKVIRYPTLLEYALYQEGALPAGISTFCSSAIDTLTDIYGLPAEVLMIPEALLKPEKVEVMRSLYVNYRERGIPVIPLHVPD